jgi:hypothetical protein
VRKKAYQLYQQSKKNLKTDSPDLADEIIVALWEQGRNINEENIKLKEEIKQQAKRLAEQYNYIDILETKSAVSNGSYIKSLDGETQIASVTH